MIELITKYHKDQFRNKTEQMPPKIKYLDHLIGVKSILSTAIKHCGECTDEKLLQDMFDAALGHDLLEDTDVSNEEIVTAANERVLQYIFELTNPVDDAHTDEYMKKLSTASEEARLIKYADLIENTSSVCYNLHILGNKWVREFYFPIVYPTVSVLEKSLFKKYPRSAGYMHSILKIYLDLISTKLETTILFQ